MRIKDKIKEIEILLEELNEILSDSIEEYKKDFKTKAACERYAERIIGTIIDLAFLYIKNKKFKTPEEEKEAFDILASENIISNKLANRLKEAKGMRNILAHEYGKIDDEIIFESLKDELEKDTREFIKKISK